MLGQKLKERGFHPLFILREEERKEWSHASIQAPRFSTFSEMAQAVCESGYMIGNDSGIGHLASCCGVPTLTICRHPGTAHFWKPAWSKGEIIAPFSWIPNLKYARLRDRYWQQWISVSRVLKQFEKQLSSSDP